MKIRGKTIAGVLFCAALMLLEGCGTSGETGWTPQEADAISVSSDGSVTEIVQESLDQAYYDLTELETMIQDSVDQYNQANGADSVKIRSLNEQDNTVTLRLKFASGKDFAAFNNIEFYQGSIINAQLEGYLFDVSFYQVQDGEMKGSAVDSTMVLKDMSAEVLIVQAPLEVHVDGDVTFISTNAEVLSESTVFASGKTEQDKQSVSLLLPSGSVHDDSGMSFAEQKAENRVYILYEE